MEPGVHPQKNAAEVIDHSAELFQHEKAVRPHARSEMDTQDHAQHCPTIRKPITIRGEGNRNRFGILSVYLLRT
jgi:hypothetical protein